MNNKDIKYNMDIRKEKEKFINVYDGNQTNDKINNLNEKTEYEFRICSYYNNIVSIWSEIKKFSTLENLNNSKILKKSKREKEFLSKIYEWTNCKNLELIFRASKDGMTSANFHQKCDNKNPPVVLYQNTKDSLFVRYTFH